MFVSLHNSMEREIERGRIRAEMKFKCKQLVAWQLILNEINIAAEKRIE